MYYKWNKIILYLVKVFYMLLFVDVMLLDGCVEERVDDNCLRFVLFFFNF